MRRTNTQRRRSGVAKIGAALLITATSLIALGQQARAAATPASVAMCSGADVSINPTAEMYGTLCVPAGGGTSTVMVLVPGATYDSIYWNFPYQPQIYNFRLAMNQAGIATYVLDRLGTGESSRPLGALVTPALQAEGIHDSITALKDGEIGDGTFHTVILGGHSLGSMEAVLEASTYHDENALLLTGYSNQLNPAGTLDLIPQFYPATLDPQLSAEGYDDPSYLTTRPGGRSIFYNLSDTDPAVISEDENTKSVSSVAEFSALVDPVVLAPSDGIHIPVLLADGEDDPFFCGTLGDICGTAATLKAAESADFPPACLQTYVLPDAGHDINLELNTQGYQSAVLDWLNVAVLGTPASC
jgi:pimeloyl-ACP methyl ester carboxylesterase